MKTDLIVEKIKKEIEQFAHAPLHEEVGTVLKVGDGVAEIDGLLNASFGETVMFDVSGKEDLEEALKEEKPLLGLLLNLEEDVVKAVVLGEVSRVKEGMTVRRVGKILSIPVGEAIVGRVVNALGEPLDGKGAIESKKEQPLERVASGVIDRAPVNTPLHTGLKAIDAMIPIGRGQRELIIGDRATGKTTIAIDAILNQKNEPEGKRPICIYVAIGQKESKTARIVHELSRRGAMAWTIVVTASAAESAALQFLAPFAGASIGEYFMEQGKDALVIYDDLSKHAVAYRALSLLLRRPPGREAYPGDIFYLHSRLLERAAKLSPLKGGGSLTALPIIETQEGDVSAYIPTNVISITDGQIFLDAELFNKGNKPAVNVGISVSRVGSNAQTKAMKKVAGKIRLELAQFRELEAFMQFSQDLDADTKARIEKGRRLGEVLNQGKHSPVPFERQVVAIFAATAGAFEKVPVEKVSVAEQAFLSHLEREYPKLLGDIARERDITPPLEETLRKAVSSFAASYQ